MAANSTTSTKVSGPITGTSKSLSFETGLLAQQSQGAVVGRIGDTIVTGHRQRRPVGARRHRLLPPDRRRRGADVRGWKDPGFFLPP